MPNNILNTNEYYKYTALKKFNSCSGFNFKECIRCYFWKKGGCSLNRDQKKKG